MVIVWPSRAHTPALTLEGEVYAWGSYSREKLSISSSSGSDEIKPVKASGLNGFDKKLYYRRLADGLCLLWTMT